MEENKQADLNPASDEETITTATEITEMSEDELEQVSGGGTSNNSNANNQDASVKKAKTSDKLSTELWHWIKS